MVPILVFSVVFGPSMDYEVFLLSRVKEEYERIGDNTRTPENLEEYKTPSPYPLTPARTSNYDNYKAVAHFGVKENGTIVSHERGQVNPHRQL